MNKPLNNDHIQLQSINHVDDALCWATMVGGKLLLPTSAPDEAQKKYDAEYGDCSCCPMYDHCVLVELNQ